MPRDQFEFVKHGPESAVAVKKSRPRRQTTRQQVQAEQRRFTVEQEKARLDAMKRRVRPIDPLRRSVFGITLGIAGVIFVASFLFSITGIAAVAEWSAPQWPWLAWVAPFFVEAMIAYAALDSIISQARGDRRQSRTATILLYVFTSIAVAGNVAHTLGQDGLDPLDWRNWFGAAFGGLAPVAVALVSSRMKRLLFVQEVEG